MIIEISGEGVNQETKTSYVVLFENTEIIKGDSIGNIIIKDSNKLVGLNTYKINVKSDGY